MALTECEGFLKLVILLKTAGIKVYSLGCILSSACDNEIALAEIAEFYYMDLSIFVYRDTVHAAFLCEQPFAVYFKVFRIDAHSMIALRCYSVQRRRFHMGIRRFSEYS